MLNLTKSGEIATHKRGGAGDNALSASSKKENGGDGGRFLAFESVGREKGSGVAKDKRNIVVQ